jgi:DNA-directed RNA polymerase subunit RPC12/RpoP
MKTERKRMCVWHNGGPGIERVEIAEGTTCPHCGGEARPSSFEDDTESVSITCPRCHLDIVRLGISRLCADFHELD